MTFTQTMTVQADSAEALAGLLQDWHRDQDGVAPGYRGARLLADQERAGRYVIEVDFASGEEAQQNSARPETRAWAEKLQGLVQGGPEYHDYAVVFSTR